jgi:hypothetical protein
MEGLGVTVAKRQDVFSNDSDIRKAGGFLNCKAYDVWFTVAE